MGARPKILITGDKGFIATNLKTKLKEVFGERFEIFGFDEDEYNHSDISKFLDYEFEHVFHMAALARTVDCTDDPFGRSFNSNIVLTNWILKLKFKSIIYTSSCAIYGDQNSGRKIKETDFVNPPSIYAAQKLYSENLINYYCTSRNLTSVCLRLFNTYGPGQSQVGSYPNVIAALIKKSKEKGYVEITGNGNQTRDFVYVKDVVRALIMSMNIKNGNHIYNVCSGVETSINEIASYMTKTIKYIPEREFDIKKQVASYDNIQSELGWTPLYSLDEGMKETLIREFSNESIL